MSGEVKKGNRTLKPLFPNQLVTLGDLEEFKAEILLGIKHLLNEEKKNTSGQWLKSYQVRQLLGISPGTLQTLRSNGTIPYSKIGKIFYYSMDDIDKLIEGKKINLKAILFKK